MLQVIQSFIPLASEIVDSGSTSHFIVLPPVVGELKLCHLGRRILPQPVVPDYEWHVSAILAEKAKSLEMCFNQTARFS